MDFSFIATAFIAFFSTTLDDILAVVFLFLKRHNDPHIQHPFIKIITGQVIGFTIIISISLLGLALGAAIPTDYIDLIGLIPLLIGLYKTYEIISEDCFNNEKNETIEDGDEKDNDAETAPIIRREESSGNEISSDIDNEIESNFIAKSLAPFLKTIGDSLIVESALYSLMCGTDNITIYIALFASISPVKVAITIIIFYLLLIFNATVAYLIVNVSLKLLRSC